MSRSKRLLRWWGRHTLRFRITLTVGVVALVALLLLSRLGASLLYDTLVGAADAELSLRAETAASRIAEGQSPAQAVLPGIRIVDTAGVPLDGGPTLEIPERQLRRLAAGEAITIGDFTEVERWLAVAAVAPDGTTRLVVANADLVGGSTLLRRATGGFLFGALVVAAVVAAAAWAATRAALRPVDRLRSAAAALPPGERLPVPVARDELRSLAEEMNLLLARRDDAVARLERFTGDAAHELRSPVAAIRAQAEVAVAHPDPDLADETLRAIADETTRLTTLLADLLALSRADAGQRAAAVPVDLIAAVRTAVERAATTGTEGPALEVVTPVPALVAATPSEVALVLDNLISNAQRYATTLVRVGVLPAGRWVRLVVEDDGPGIPEADRTRIFDRFTRLNPEAGGGAGLGLALVNGRGGIVTAGSTATGGARIEVRWRAPWSS